MIQLLIADDHKVLLDGFISIFQEVDDISVVATASNGLEVMELIKKHKVDIILLDINMPEMDGIEVCKQVVKTKKKIKVIALSMYQQASYIKRMRINGAKGYLLKSASAEEICEAIRKVHTGEEYYSQELKDILLNDIFSSNEGVLPKITKREKEILELIGKGHSNKSVAEMLFISAHTVISHRKNMLSKFNVKNSTELIKVATDHGLI